MNYTYDALNRLTLAETAGSGGWGQGFGYDGFGNLTAKTATKGSVPVLSVSFDGTTNRLVGGGYDANGNGLGYGVVFDVENRMVGQTLNGLGTRWVYDPSGKRVFQDRTWYAAMEYCVLRGRRAEADDDAVRATHVPSRGAGRVHGDGVHERVQRVFRGEAGEVPGSGGGDGPAGERAGEREWGEFCVLSVWGGAGDECGWAGEVRDILRDAVGQDYADQRYYGVGTGRFGTPDPVGVSAALAGNPGTWNRYGYVQGDPVNFNDASGKNAFAVGSDIGGALSAYCRMLPWGYCMGQEDATNGGGGGGCGGISVMGFMPMPDPTCYADPGPLPDEGLKRRDPPEKILPIYCEPDVIASMKMAWTQSQNGQSASGLEASFRVDGSPRPGNYEIVPTPFTNQPMKQTMEIIRGATFAIFHVHPNKGDPHPSNGKGEDIDIANTNHLDIYTITSRGWFMYDYADKAVMKLRDGLDWMKPCDQ